MPTFNFELRDFGAALAKEEMRISDKSRDAAEYLEGWYINYWSHLSERIGSNLNHWILLQLCFLDCTRCCDMCSNIELTPH